MARVTVTERRSRKRNRVHRIAATTALVAVIVYATAQPSPLGAEEKRFVPSVSRVTTGSFHIDGRWVGGYVEGSTSFDTSYGAGWFGVSKKTRINYNEMVEIVEAIYLEDVPRYRFDHMSWSASAFGTMPSIVTRIDWTRTDKGWTATDVQRPSRTKISLRWRGIGQPSFAPSVGAVCTGLGGVIGVPVCILHPAVVRRGTAEVWGWIDFGGLGLRIHVPEGKKGSITDQLPVLQHGI